MSSGSGLLLGTDPKSGTFLPSWPVGVPTSDTRERVSVPAYGANVSTCGGWTYLTGRFPVAVPFFVFDFQVRGSWVKFMDRPAHFAFQFPGRTSVVDRGVLIADDYQPVAPAPQDFWDFGFEFRRLRLRNGAVGGNWFFDLLVGTGPFFPNSGSP